MSGEPKESDPIGQEDDAVEYIPPPKENPVEVFRRARGKIKPLRDDVDHLTERKRKIEEEIARIKGEISATEQKAKAEVVDNARESEGKIEEE